MEIIIGILLGWLLPCPAVIGSIERRIWDPLKNRFPACRKWLG